MSVCFNDDLLSSYHSTSSSTNSTRTSNKCLQKIWCGTINIISRNKDKNPLNSTAVRHNSRVQHKSSKYGILYSRTSILSKH